MELRILIREQQRIDGQIADTGLVLVHARNADVQRDVGEDNLLSELSAEEFLRPPMHVAHGIGERVDAKIRCEIVSVRADESLGFVIVDVIDKVVTRRRDGGGEKTLRPVGIDPAAVFASERSRLREKRAEKTEERR